MIQLQFELCKGIRLSEITTIRIKGQDLHQPEKWLTVIDKTYAWTAENNNLRYQVAKLKYKGVDYRSICIERHISAKFQYLLLEKFRELAAWQAKEVGLISKEEFEKIFL